jgi:hypothetical protein
MQAARPQKHVCASWTTLALLGHTRIRWPAHATTFREHAEAMRLIHAHARWHMGAQPHDKATSPQVGWEERRGGGSTRRLAVATVGLTRGASGWAGFGTSSERRLEMTALRTERYVSPGSPRSFAGAGCGTNLPTGPLCRTSAASDPTTRPASAPAAHTPPLPPPPPLHTLRTRPTYGQWTWTPPAPSSLQ